MYINLQQLRVFYLANKYGSMAAAAKKMFVSRAAITMQIRKFEEQLGFELFSSKRGKLRLTEYGKGMYGFAESIFAQVESMERYAETVMRDKQDVLKLGAHHVMAQYFLPPMTEHISLLYPNLQLQVVLGTRGDFCEKILLKEMHAALIMGTVKDPKIVSKTLFYEEAVLVASPHGALAARQNIAAQELASVPLILQQKGTGIHAAILDFLRTHMVKPQIHLENISSDIIKTFLVQKNDTAAFIPRYAVQKELANGTLREIKVEEGLPVNATNLIYLKQSKLPLALQLFINIMSTFQFSGQ